MIEISKNLSDRLAGEYKGGGGSGCLGSAREGVSVVISSTSEKAESGLAQSEFYLLAIVPVQMHGTVARK